VFRPTYLNRPTAASGLVPVYSAINLTAASNNISPSTLYSNALRGLYWVSVHMIVAGAATVSSTLPDSQIIYTDENSGATATVSATTGQTGNITSTFTQTSFVIDAQFNSTIQYSIVQVTPYATSGATSRQFAYHARLEYLG
jgi:hypothetical protein